MLVPLKPASSDPIEAYITWSLGAPKGDECCRWHAVDGRWVALSLGQGDEMGRVVLTTSEGVRELIDSYEDALLRAKYHRF